MYRPVKIRGQEITNTYRCIPGADSDDGPTGKLVYSNIDDFGTEVDRNLADLKTAFSDLEFVHRDGTKVRIIAPVNAQILSNSTTSTRLIEIIKDVDVEIRKAIVPEVFGFPQDMNLDMLEDITIPLLPFFDFYMACPELDMTDYTLFTNVNYFGVTADMEMFNAETENPEKALTRAWSAATNRRLKFYVQGIDTKEIADTAMRYESFAIDGPFIATDSYILGGMPKS